MPTSFQKYVFFWIAGIVNAQQFQNETIKSKLDSANYNSVKEMADLLIKNNKCDVEGWYFKAKAEIQSNNDKSLTPYESVLNFERCYRKFAEDKSLTHQNNIMLADVRFMDLFYVIGLRYSKAKDYNRSAEWYNLARFKYKNDDFFNMELGLSNLAIKNYKIAISAFEKVIQIDSCNARAYYNLACSFSLIRDKNSAIKNLKYAIKYDKAYKTQALNDSDLKSISNTKEFVEMTK